ncbi:hypothetical protein GH714_039461 [Hevea brasiliensis]|uniref:NAC domain-containing protein n=1 Tax=Hevea brasiliensis TaxID=3981 RepID=A0A6A6MI83_HEVBR|nr:hypothetical protein GH714_039461 [Hevea brasiliensis]
MNSNNNTETRPDHMDDDEEEVALPGFRFHPTDEELVGFYLRRKIDKKPLKPSSVGEKEGYFFCKRGRKYRNSIRPNRVTRSGFWKATGIDKPVYSNGGEGRDCIGLKKTLVYYRGSAGKGTKTEWMMHEFRLPPTIATPPTLSTLKALPKKRRENYLSFGAPHIQYSDKKPVINHVNERKQLHADQLSSITQPPSMASSSNISSPYENEVFAYGDWDELRSVVEFAFGPSLLSYNFSIKARGAPEGVLDVRGDGYGQSRGNGHSTYGQDMANNGVVVDMKGLREQKKGDGVVIISKNPLIADVGGEQLWIDVLNATTKEGVAPVSWTDYLELSVGGLFLMLESVGKRFVLVLRLATFMNWMLLLVLWSQTLFSNFSDFTTAQENFIANNTLKPGDNNNGMIYLEGGLILDNGTPNTWRTFFFPPADLPKISSLVKQHGIIYSLEIARSYEDVTKKTVEKEMKQSIKGLSSMPEYSYQKDVSYLEFLTRVQITVLKNESHPWLNLLIPKSRISDFDSGVFRDIVLKRNITTGPVLFYPMFRNTWNNKTSAAIPDEDIFYTAGLLYTSGINDWQVYEDQNKAILEFCDKAGINVKQYLANHTTKEEWIKHFGSKWAEFEQRKALFDPKMILSPGQRIFNNN